MTIMRNLQKRDFAQLTIFLLAFLALVLALLPSFHPTGMILEAAICVLVMLTVTTIAIKLVSPLRYQGFRKWGFMALPNIAVAVPMAVFIHDQEFIPFMFSNFFIGYLAMLFAEHRLGSRGADLEI